MLFTVVACKSTLTSYYKQLIELLPTSQLCFSCILFVCPFAVYIFISHWKALLITLFLTFTWQDISAEEAHQLHSLLSILVQRSSEIFQNTQEADSESAENTWVRVPACMNAQSQLVRKSLKTFKSTLTFHRKHIITAKHYVCLSGHLHRCTTLDSI